MIVKRMYQFEDPEDYSSQWFDCDKAIECFDKGKGHNMLMLYKDTKLVTEICYDPKNKNGFTVYFLEAGKTVDTRYWNLK